MSALGRIAAPESLPLLIEALRDPHPWVRTNAVVAIARLAAKDRNVIERPEMAQDALRVLELLDDPDPGTRASSIDALGYYAVHSEPARRRLLDVAANGSRWDRELAAGAIAKNLGDEKLLPAELSGWAKVRVLEARQRRLRRRSRALRARSRSARARAGAGDDRRRSHRRQPAR